MTVLLSLQPQVITDSSGLPTRDFRNWQLAVTNAVNAPADVAPVTPVPPVSGDYLPLSTFVKGTDRIEYYGSLATGGVSLGLGKLADTATGTFQLIDARDPYGCITGVADGTAADVPYDNATSGLAADDVQAAIDELSAEKLDDAPSNGTLYGRKNGAWAGFSGVGYTEGTTNPGSPATGDKFYRTDLNLLIYYDGTRWLTVNEYTMAGVITDLLQASSLTTPNYRWPVRQDLGTYLTRWIVTTFVAGTNNGSNYYTASLNRRDAANTNTLISSFNTSADAASAWANHDQAINAVLNASALQLQATITKTGSPAAWYAIPAIAYRLIVT